MILYGKVIADKLIENLKQEIFFLKQQNIIPKLAIVQLVDDESLNIYFKTRKRIADQIGVDIELYKCYSEKFDDLKDLINLLNRDDSINGIMIDEPFNPKFNKKKVFSLIDKKKDIENINNQSKNINIPVAQSILETLDYYNLKVEGKSVCVIGTSENVGLPIAKTLIQRGANVISCDKNTIDISSISTKSDFVIVAIGKREFIDSKFVSKNSVLFDIGVHYDEQGFLCGDVERSVYDLVKHVSPSPKGTGPITNVVLFKNLICLIKEEKGYEF